MEGGTQQRHEDHQQDHDAGQAQEPLLDGERQERRNETGDDGSSGGWAEPAETRPDPPRIYVASLSDYNAGRLHGVWLEADQEAGELRERIGAMLAASAEPGAEEWAIHDFEGFGAVRLGEWENLERVSHIARGIREHGVAFAHWVNLAGADEDLDRFDEAYVGHWDSVTAYAEELLDDLGLEREIDRVVPESLRAYVTLDAEGFGRDLELGGDISTFEGDGGVYVFCGRW